MTISPLYSVAIIFVTAAATFLTRILPFLVFNGRKPIPKIVTYLGNVLPPAVISALILYCVKSVDFGSLSSVLPQIVAIGAVVVLHLWRKNSLLSIGGGTIIYMILVQLVLK